MENLIRYAPLLASGAIVTVSLALLSLALATLLGGLGAAGRLGGGPVVRGAIFAYTTLMRGVPDLVWLFLVYFGGQRLVNVATGTLGLEQLSVTPFIAGVFTIGLIYGAYLTETFRGAYLTISPGQTEAAMALGMRGLPLQWKVVIPQLIRFALPGYGNVWQVLVKATAIVSVIGLQDMVGLANDAGKAVREPFIFFFAVLLAYLLITWVSQTLLGVVEDRTSAGATHAR
jgi:His/Glu/Gln/Arg/opine family amino acid ABC transporter permease subunit